MTRLFISLMMTCLVLLSLVMIACSTQTDDTTEPVLTEEQIELGKKELAERGGLNVETIEEASLIVGYEIAVPNYIPEDFRLNNNIMITQRGARLPGDIAKNFPPEVQQIWLWEKDASVIFMLTQSPKEFGVGSSGDNYSFVWNDGNMYYAITGIMAGPLTEEVLQRIAESVDVN